MECNFIFRPIDKWPGERKRRPKSSAFRTKYNQTLVLLDKELIMLGVRQAVIQIDLPESKIRIDGLPRSGARPDYQGVPGSVNNNRSGPRRLRDIIAGMEHRYHADAKQFGGEIYRALKWSERSAAGSSAAPQLEDQDGCWHVVQDVSPLLHTWVLPADPRASRGNACVLRPLMYFFKSG